MTTTTTKHLDFTIDFETCALSANAAPMQVAIVPWRREAENDPFAVADDLGEVTEDESARWPDPYEAYVDLRSCIVEGMDFDPATVNWWSRQSDEAKHAVCQGLAEPIADVTVGIIDYLREIIKQYQLYSICLWAQGDTDISQLRSLCHRFDINMEDTVPHTSFRDCRTVILEAALVEAKRSMSGKSTRANGIALPHQIQADPSLAYLLVPSLPSRYAEGRCQHDALYDALRSTWYTWQALRTLRD